MSEQSRQEAATMAKSSFFHSVAGSGNVVSETREARDFDRITLSGVGTVTIAQTGEESLAIEAEDNILPLLTSEVHDHELELSVQHDAHISPRASIHFYVTVKDLHAISLSGAGKIELSTLKSRDLRLALSGSGDLTAPELSAETLDIRLSGAGKIAVDRLTASELDVTLSGLGNVKLAGHVARQTVSIPGAGSYDAVELTSDHARVKMSGAGSATVNVSETLEATVSGVGSIRYAGQPRVRRSVSGLGSIHPING
jgi:hypothetical protein